MGGLAMATESRLSLTAGGKAIPLPLPDGWTDVVIDVLKTLIPPDTPHWEIHLAIIRDTEGCTDVHLHTCVHKPEQKEPIPESAPKEGYL
jgi:hypothetical protein